MEIAKGFRVPGRYRGVGRAARAYLAGVGTTGSLLAGAALMFIVASALVAFRSWPLSKTVTGVTNGLGGIVSGLGH